MIPIDLSRHGVIEAHAGTGKTWTIVNRLVVPMLKGEGCPRTHISELLLVTYTEKAAGELRKRISEGIHAASADPTCDGFLAMHLRDCLNQLPDALIGTIHSVCLRLLQRYPFETVMHFSPTIVDDKAGLRECLRESIRQDWPTWDCDLSGVLQSIKGMDYDVEGNLLDRIVQTAQWCLDPTSVLRREGLAPWSDLTAVLEAMRHRNECSDELAGLVNVQLPVLLSLEADPRGLDDVRLDKLRSVIGRWRTVVRQGTVHSKSDILDSGRSGDALANKLIKGNKVGAQSNPLISSACEAFRRVVDSPAMTRFEACADPAAALRLALILEAVPAVCDRWRQRKEQEGLLSYDDVLRKTRDAFAGNPAWRAQLASQIRAIIIDEFQDTSALQWEIFRILAQPGSARGERLPLLYLVGDPKQSIYSFQGADVTSYHAARTMLLDQCNAQLVCLWENFRSLPQTIEAYNQLLTMPAGGESGAENFFLSSDIAYDLPAQAPDREAVPKAPVPDARYLDSLLSRPLRLVALSGPASGRLRNYAACAAKAIRSIVGRSVTLPNGTGWQTRTVLYSDCAVLAETNSQADNFLDLLHLEGIPAAKYKREGIFSCNMAVQFAALLRAVDSRTRAERTSALLTVFFNLPAATLNPESVLRPGSKISSLFEKWEALSAARDWSRLMHSLVNDTRVRELLIRLADGTRQLSDLRQMVDYALLFLTTRQATLAHLVAHLDDLALERTAPLVDSTLHEQESDTPRVQVMTIHAAKGLEFVVCFLVTGSSDRASSICRWLEIVPGTNESVQRLQIMPMESGTALSRHPTAQQAELLARNQRRQERRRLLYVALTRACALTFVPLHLQELPGEPGAPQTYGACSLPKYGKDGDFTPLLQYAADQATRQTGHLALVDDETFNFPAQQPPRPVAASIDQLPPLPQQLLEEAHNSVMNRLRELAIPARRRLQASYTLLAHQVPEPADLQGRTDRDGQHLMVSRAENDRDESASDHSILRPGPVSGTVLHNLLEYAVERNIYTADSSDLSADALLRTEARRLLTRFGLCENRSEDEICNGIDQAAAMVRRTFAAHLPLPGEGHVCLSHIPSTCLRAEVEFHLDMVPHWIIGYVDLLVRIPSVDGAWRYFVVDWKSNCLPAYDAASIEHNVMLSRYDLQARIYCYALHRWLSSLQGNGYKPDLHLGGALYVYLRGLNDSAVQPVWYHPADPITDHHETARVLQSYVNYANRQVTSWH